MRLSHFFISRPIFAIVLSLFIHNRRRGRLLVCAGRALSRGAPPTIQVTASYPGASAEVLSKTVATRSNNSSTASRTCSTSPVSRQATASWW